MTQTRLVLIAALLTTAAAGCAGHDQAILDARHRVRDREDAALAAEYDRYVETYGAERGAELFRARFGR